MDKMATLWQALEWGSRAWWPSAHVTVTWHWHSWWVVMWVALGWCLWLGLLYWKANPAGLLGLLSVLQNQRLRLTLYTPLMQRIQALGTSKQEVALAMSSGWTALGRFWQGLWWLWWLLLWLALSQPYLRLHVDTSVEPTIDVPSAWLPTGNASMEREGVSRAALLPHQVMVVVEASANLLVRDGWSKEAQENDHDAIIEPLTRLALLQRSLTQVLATSSEVAYGLLLVGDRHQLWTYPTQDAGLIRFQLQRLRAELAGRGDSDTVAGLLTAARLLVQQRQDSSAHVGQDHIVWISDGVHARDTSGWDGLVAVLKHHHIALHALGMGQVTDEHATGAPQFQTAGLLFAPQKPQRLQQLAQASFGHYDQLQRVLTQPDLLLQWLKDSQQQWQDASTRVQPSAHDHQAKIDGGEATMPQPIHRLDLSAALVQLWALVFVLWLGLAQQSRWSLVSERSKQPVDPS